MEDIALLPVLRKASNEDLNPLVEFIMKAEWTEELSLSEKFKCFSPDHSRYVGEIAKEIRFFGGNAFLNLVRDEGETYEKIVLDVAKKIKVKCNVTDSVEELEIKILLNILEKAYAKMNDAEKEDVIKVFKEAGLDNADFSAGFPTAAIMAQIVINMAGFLAYRMSLIVVNAVAKYVLGHGLKLAANAAITRVMGIFAGPIGWAITGLWTVVDIAGPAYRVTIPCVCWVAYLRQKIKHQEAF